MSAPAVRVDVRPDTVAVLAIDQPGSRVNVLTQELWTELESAIDALARRPDLRGLVVASGKPGVFIAGADLKMFANAPAPNDPAVRAFIEQGLRVLEKLEALPFPTCAAIDGAALGGGLEVALACDYRLAGTNPKVQFGLPEVKLGLIPGWGGTQRLPRVVGLKPAAGMLTTGTSLTGAQAEDAGLMGVQSVPDLIEATAGFLVELQLAGGVLAELGDGPDWRKQRTDKRQPIPESTPRDLPPLAPDASIAAREARSVMLHGAELSLAEAIRLETEAFMRLAGSPESNQLVAEFFASRKK
ncbi:MAG: fadJ 1 [Gemmataceae bacterium]|nr:fadJ 1 [Gemmataceae bacterium]